VSALRVAEPVRVLHVSQPTEAGVARCVVDLVRDQLDRGYEVTVASPATGWLRRQILDAGARHLVWRATRTPARAASEIRGFSRIVNEVEPDIVHLHSAKAGLVGRLVVRRARRTIYQPHAWSFLAARGSLRRAAIAWERIAAGFANAIVCVSEDERRVAERLRIRGNWRTIANGIDLERFTPASTEEAARTRRALGVGVGASTPLAVCIGRLSEQKGQDVLLDAWPRVLARVPDARLAIVGGGPRHAMLERRLPPGVVLTGHVDDTRPWLVASDVVVIASRWEGLSITMLESMATGRSVVSTDVAGAAEALSHGGGAIVPVGDGVALADAVGARLADRGLAEREGRRARRTAVQAFDLRRTTRSTSELYEELLTGAPRLRRAA
jgi:glycosyltransferase involved in cell wall biosynthesis